MKTIKSTLVVILATFALLASLAAASTAVSLNAPPDNLDNDGADLTLRPDGGSYTTGETIEILANFQSTSAGHSATLYKETAEGSNTYEVVEVDDAANSFGNAYFHPEIDSGARKYYAEDDQNGDQTEVKTITGVAAPPSGAVLNTSTDGGKTFKATFNPAASGQSTELKVREICTYETDETNPETGGFDPDVKQKDCLGPWKTRATGTQNSSGATTFTLSDPLEVSHKYKAVSGSTTSNEVTFAAPLPTNPYDSTGTGLSEVHFNSYEGDSINTRTRYFEGEFSMTESSATGCSTVAAMPKSVMKGRGNYSWSFPKKSFTLKIDKKTNVCGMGIGKKYAMVANDYDKSLTRNALAQFVGSKFNRTGWTPESVPVDFFINGSYRGSYMLVERIAIQGSVQNNTEDPPDTYSDRVNIHELNGDDDSENSDPGITGGYVLEWDFRAADNDSSAPDRFIDIGTRGLLGVKEPEDDRDREGGNTGAGISPQQLSYIRDYVETCDDKLYSSNFTSDSFGGWKSCIDIDSAVDYYLGMEFMKPVDGNMWASVYMYKPREGKLTMGPMWDFDLAAGSANRAGNVVSSSSWYLRNNLGVSAQQTSKTWFNRLNEDPDFRDAVKARWNQVQDNMNVSGFVNGHEDLIRQSATANFKKWPYSSSISQYQVKKGSWQKDIDYVGSWASGRRSWINGQL